MYQLIYIKFVDVFFHFFKSLGIEAARMGSNDWALYAGADEFWVI